MEETKKPKQSKIERLEKEGIPLSYVRFQAPVPPYVNAEPLYEFNTAGTSKYVVESITLSVEGIIWRARGELDISPTANYQYGRVIQSAL